MNRILLAAALALGLSSVAPNGTAWAASGTLMIYTSTPDKAMNDLIATFNKVEPNVKVEFFRSGTTEVVNKLQAEFTAGAPQPDVLFIADATVMEQMKADGRLMAYADAPLAGLPASFYDADKTYFGTKIIPTGIVYNTNSGKPRPTSWLDLISPNAKDQVIMPSPLYSGAAVIHVGTIIGQPEMGWNYYQKLADNGAVATKGNGGVLDAVASGQKAYGMIVDFMAFNGKAKGSPVDFVYPLEGVSMVTEPVAILKTAKNVDAAKAFVNWLLSDAGQQYMVVQGYIPGKEGVAGPAGRPGAGDLKLMPASAKEVTGETDEIKKKFSDLFGG
ncbi:MAG TPA: ABC transporter substrate-binding protein [Dongiaceae bacterium]|nr:ABC transporter substrate-binding protein [Dongiaceae bacterium]